MNKTVITKTVTIGADVFTANAELVLHALNSGEGMVVRNNAGTLVYINPECCPTVLIAEASVTSPIVLNPIAC